jgi:hypothetical protein
MTVIANAGLVLKDSQGNKGIVKSFTDNDIDKISSAITDVGQVVDPATHMPIEATKTSAGVVQLATATDIENGTAGKVVDAQELNNFAQTLPAANGVTDVSSGDNSNQLVVSRIGGSKTLTIDNVEHADNADEATHATQADTATSANSVAWDNVSGKPSSFTPSSHTHDDRYYTESEIDTKLSGKSDTTHNHNSTYLGITAKAESAKSADSVAWSNVSGKPSTYTPSSHTHDDRYYTESEINTKLSNLLLQIYPVGAIYISANSTNPGTLFGGTWKALDQGRVLIGANSTYKAGATGGEFTHKITTSEMPSHTHTGTTGNESAGHTHSGTTGNQSAGHTHSWSGTTSSDGKHGHKSWTDSTGSHQHNSGHGWHIADTDSSGKQCLSNSYVSGDSWSENVTSSNGAHSHSVGVESNGAHTHTVSGTTGGISANHTHSFTTGGISAHHTHSFTTGASGSGSAMNNMQPYLAVYMWQRTA